ncbi:MAG: hypothetical protein EA404_02115 [Spirochaetaceae bacterium]|nr:MAG: hypothetical protein EA404_02115 [Spirochaetaceae bacterium]
MKRSRSDVMHYSLSEFAFILLFLAAGALALLYARYAAAEQLNAEYQSRIAELTAEIDFLGELLAETQYGVVPCWRRPDGGIPAVVGTLTIHAPGSLSAERTLGGRTLAIEAADGDSRAALIRATLAELFAAELAYADQKNCYLRLVIENRTDSYAHYRDLTSIVSRGNLVVVNE